MGESKNGAKAQIKRNRDTKESSSSKRGPEHNTGHRRQRPQERRSASNMALQIHGKPDRQSAKDAPQLTQEPERIRKRYAFYGSGCGRMPRAQLAAISARVSSGIISILTYPARISFGV